jgi:hypothetical protein
MSNTPNISDGPIQINSDKYLIKIIESGPQIIDKNNNFYVKDRRPSKSPSRKNIIAKSSLCYKFNKEQMMLDQLITSKVKKQEQFEKIVADPLIEKFLK